MTLKGILEHQTGNPYSEDRRRECHADEHYTNRRVGDGNGWHPNTPTPRRWPSPPTARAKNSDAGYPGSTSLFFMNLLSIIHLWYFMRDSKP
jgi:hypothetical protein